MNRTIDRFQYVDESLHSGVAEEPVDVNQPLPALPHEEIADLSAAALYSAYGAGDMSPVDVQQALFERIEACNAILGAFFFLNKEEAASQARASEQRWRNKEPLSRLDGVPVSFKDELEVRNWPAPHGAVLRKDVVDENDSQLAANLRGGGMVFMGKTTMPDYGWSPTCMSSAYPLCLNPWSLGATVGGSSGGAAAAAAARLGPVHMGADGGGSIRIPASYCGVFGHKPSRGRLACPPDDMIVHGPITRTVEDAALAMSLLARPTGGRDDVLPREVEAYEDALDSFDPASLKIGYRPYSGDCMAPTDEVLSVVDKAVAMLRNAGLAIEDAPPDFEKGEIESVFPLIRLQVAQTLLEEHSVEEMRKGFPRPLWTWIEGVLNQPADEIMQTLGPKFMAFAEGMSKDAVSRYDVVLSPTMPNVAHAADAMAPPELDDVVAREGLTISHIQPLPFANLWGNAAASLNCGYSKSGLPVGMQIMAKPGEDLKVLSVAAALERLFQPLQKPWPASA